MDKRLMGCAYSPVMGQDKGCSHIPSAKGCFFMGKPMDERKGRAAKAKPQTKEERLAAALRANLRRRKVDRNKSATD